MQREVYTAMGFTGLVASSPSTLLNTWYMEGLIFFAGKAQLIIVSLMYVPVTTMCFSFLRIVCKQSKMMCKTKNLTVERTHVTAHMLRLWVRPSNPPLACTLMTEAVLEMSVRPQAQYAQPGPIGAALWCMILLHLLVVD